MGTCSMSTQPVEARQPIASAVDDGAPDRVGAPTGLGCLSISRNGLRVDQRCSCGFLNKWRFGHWARCHQEIKIAAFVGLFDMLDEGAGIRARLRVAAAPMPERRRAGSSSLTSTFAALPNIERDQSPV